MPEDVLIEDIEEVGTITVSPWGIEADHHRNGNLIIQNIAGCKLRSRIDSSRPVVDAKTGIEGIPVDQSVALASFPRTPGMRLYVDPEKCTYKITDPLDKKDIEAIKRYFRSRQGMLATVSDELKGVPDQEGTLDPHQIKSLCREMLWLVDSGDAKRISGPKPDMEDVDALPGKYLLNPGARVRNSQPRYEEDFDQWVSNLDRTGG